MKDDYVLTNFSHFLAEYPKDREIRYYYGYWILTDTMISINMVGATHGLLVFLLNLATQPVFKKSLKNTHFIMTTKQNTKNRHCTF